VTPGGVRESRWRGNERSVGNVRAKTRGALTFAAATSPGEPAPRPVRTPAGAALAGVPAAHLDHRLSAHAQAAGAEPL